MLDISITKRKSGKKTVIPPEAIFCLPGDVALRDIYFEGIQIFIQKKTHAWMSI
jgi:hypothetical protein